MENKKLDKIIEAFRNYIYLKEEGGMVANVAGSQGAFGPDSPAAGPAAGKASIIGMVKRVAKRRKSKKIYLGKNSRKRWMKKKL